MTLKTPLRIALFGQAPLAVDCLEPLRKAGHEIVAVFAPPDASRPDPLAAHARELGIQVVQRRYFQRKDGTTIPAARAAYAELDVHLNVLASLTSFLPAELADSPKYKSICFHPSLLPRFRGGNALQWQIIEGETHTGVSIFIPDSGVDTGPIVVQRGGVPIEETDTTASLFFQKLVPLGADAICEAVDQIAGGNLKAVPQDESRASFQGLIHDALAEIDWSNGAQEIHRWIRGCDPQPGAWTRHSEQPIRLYGAGPIGEPAPSAQPGEITSISETTGIHVQARGGVIPIAKVRADAGKEPAAQFARRSGLSVGSRFASARHTP